jgi:alkanesulfonate monooxygenase SsuD/methylene tetrahydromethanopterin reductase-like flavin-dependent oxidoreductase (luciferase family)
MLSQRLGMTRGVNALIDAAHDSHSPKLPAAAEDLAHEVTLMGTYDRAEHAISAWFAAGADTVHLVLPPNRPDDELAQILAAVAGFASRTALTSANRAPARERNEIRAAT